MTNAQITALQEVLFNLYDLLEANDLDSIEVEGVEESFLGQFIEAQIKAIEAIEAIEGE